MKRLLILASVVVTAISFGQKSQILLNPDIIQVQFHGETGRLDQFVDDSTFANEVTKTEKLGYHPKTDWILNPTVNPNALPQNGDPALQRHYPPPAQNKALVQNWEGMTYTGVNPADPSVDVGPNHVVQMINGSSGSYIQVWNKTGTSLMAPVYFDNFMGMAGGAGDPIVMYDHRADRWVLTEFSAGGNNMHVAVSTTPDPTGTYYTYTFNAPNFPDYPKYSIWTDSYVITTNEAGGTAPCYALDRTSLLAGTPATAQRFTIPKFGTIGFQAAAPVNLLGTTNPPAGAPAMVMRMRDDAWTGAATDALEIWDFDIDWAIPANTSLTQNIVLPIAPYESELCGYTAFACVPQPGTGTQLDPLREVLMNKVHYRNFGTHESIVCCHVADVNGSDLHGIRWYELRRTGGTGGTWTVYQEGTYSPDSDHRWMASISISATGNIGLAYNVSSGTTYPSLRYTGRRECDPLNIMTEPETSIMAGSASNASNRYGDYNQMGVDPTDGETFWFTGMYNPAAQWSTRVAAFDLPSCNPTVQFSNSSYTVDETQANVANGCLDYYVLDVPICIAIDPSQPADITVNVTGGTATQGVDYDISNTSFTLDGTTLCGTVQIWVYNDNYVEGNETINLDYTLNANGGDATSGTINQTVTITITSDDLDPLSMTNTVTIFQDDFNDGTMAPFTTINYNNPPAANLPWQVGDEATAESGAYNIPTHATDFAYINDDACDCDQSDVDLIFPVLDLTGYTAATLTFDSYFEANTWAGDVESAEVWVSTGGPPVNIGSLVASPIDVSWTAQSFDLTPYVGNANVVIAIKYSDGGGWLYGCSVDDVLVTGEVPIGIQTAVNTGSGMTAYLGPNETVHFYDPATSDVMVTIINTSGWDYGCTTVDVDRDGTTPTALPFHSAAAPDYVTGKTYQVVPTNNNPTGTFDIITYYEEAEVAAWETITGNSRSNAEVIKVAGNNQISDVNPGNYTTFTIDNPAATLGAFYTDVTFAGSYANGFSGFAVGIFNPTTVTHTTVNTAPSCAGASDGQIVVTASGGTAPYQYSIDGGTTWQASDTFTGLAAGSYSVVVEDNNGIQSTPSTETLVDPPAVTYTANSTDENCGLSDGSLTLAGANGVTPYQYSIDGGTTFQASGSFTGLAAGSYAVVVEDANGCQATGTETVGSLAGVSITGATGTDPTCNGGNDGSINVTVSGGTTPYQYSNDNGVTFQASNTFNSLSAGSYNIVVEDANGCQDFTTVVLSDPAALSYSTTSTNENCGLSDGTLTLTASDGTAPYQYSIDGGTTFQASGSFTGLATGSYSVVIEDANGCQVTGTENVGSTAGPSITGTSSTDPSCNGGSDGDITISASGGTAPLQYSIDGGTTFQAGNSFTGLSAGTYNVVVEDANGCQDATTVTLTDPASITYSAVSTDASCGSSNGSLTLTGSNGTSPYQYSIDGGTTFQASGTFTGLAAGNYNVVVEDANGCQVTGTESINNTGGPTIANVASNDPSCNGGSNGDITITAAGGTPPLQYSIDNGVTFQAGNSFTGLSAGAYNIVVEDANGCQATSSATLTDPSAVSYTASSTDENCGLSDGTLTISGSGGIGSLQYSIDGGTTFQASGSFTGLTSGTYNIVVEDANGCQATGTESVGSAGGATINSVTAIDPTCNGGTDGSINISATGGTAPLQYSINGGTTFQAGNTFTGLVSGSYSIMVEDASGCQTVSSATLTDPAAMTYSANITDESCSGNDGSIVITVSNGTSPYQYSIDGGVTTQGTGTFSGLTATSYNIVITDADGCQVSGTESVGGGAGPVISNVSSTDPTCNGNSDGDITISASGGTAPLSYSIDGGVTFQGGTSFTGLSAGTYTIVVEDANGCQASSSATLTNPSAVTYTATVTDENCGGSDGQIDLVGANGTAPYQYSIDGGSTFQASGIFTGLTSGNYNVVVEDANGCQAIGIESVGSVGGASIDNVATNDPTCNNGADGDITITASGGTAPLQYSIDGGTTFQSGNSFSGLTSGSYNIVVEDANGCQEFTTVTLNNPAPITYSASSTAENCGASDGTLTLTGSSGTPPFNYSIDGGLTFVTSGNFTGLTAGTYNVVVEDANGCQGSGTETVGSAGGATIDNTVTTDPTCNGSSDGDITITASGGTAPLQYSIDGGTTFQTGNAFTGLSAGTYNIVVEDASGCQTVSTVTLTDPTAVSYTGSSTPELCGASDGTITLAGSGGTGSYLYSIDGGATFQASGSFTGLTAGTYTIIVQDGNSCSVNGTETVGSSGGPSVTAISSTDVSCNGSSDGSIDVTATSQNPPVQYSIDGGTSFQTTGTFAGLAGGTYTVLIEDANGCQSTIDVTIDEPSVLTLALSASNTSCGYNNGSVVASVSGGTAPYNYIWDDTGMPGPPALTNVSSGTYIVEVTDGNGCTITDSIVVEPSDSLFISFDWAHVSCDGYTDGWINTEVTGGAPPYEYSWNSGDTISDIYELGVGLYVLTVTDSLGCVIVADVDIIAENVDCIIIPTAISPNGDGANDTWIIEGLHLYPEATVEIYNRWGSLLFSANGYQNDWDGTWNGNKLPAAVYYYVVKVSDDEVYTGSLTIIR